MSAEYEKENGVGVGVEKATTQTTEEWSEESKETGSGGGDGTSQSSPVEGDVPPGYFRSSLFLGTYLAVVVSLMSGVAPFALAAPLLSDINADIGPSADIEWVGFAYNLVLACTLSLVGRLSDIFGRRWFFICGNFLALVGTVICATAVNVPMLIGGMAIASLGVATQISFQYVLGELVPVGKRFIVMSTVFPWSIPLGGFGPVISQAFQTYTGLQWRWCFWLCAILNVFSTALYFFFYHPPTFRRLEPGKTKWQAFRELDWLGMTLFSSGLFLFLMGLAWGGNAHPWKSAAVLCPLLIGFALLAAFVAWELLADLRIPFIPMRLFRNLRWVAMMLCLAIGATQYYALALVWPKMIIALWPTKAAAVPMGFGLMATLTGLGLQFGQIGGALIANWFDKKILLLISTAIGAVLLAGAAAANEHNLGTVLGLLIPGFLGIGAQEAVTGVFCTVALKDQADIGVGGGVAATIRAGMSALGSVIYSSVLKNRLQQTVPSMVHDAAVGAGLPAESVPALLKYLQGTGTADQVTGMTQDILAGATTAFRTASSYAFRDVMLTTLAFGACSVICAFFTPKIDQSQANLISRVLQRERKGGKDKDAEK